MTLEAILKICRQRTAILALLALLLGQWVLLTHVHEQGAPAAGDTCWLCIHAQHDGNAIPTTGMALAVIPHDMPLPLPAYVHPVAVSYRHFNPRAPPLS